MLRFFQRMICKILTVAIVASFFVVPMTAIAASFNPTHVGAITDDGTTELDGAMSIYVSGNYAYVASAVDDGVEILDISNPANPTHVGAITDDGVTELDGARGIYVSGNYAYVASAVDDGVEILDISNPANPTHVGAITDDGTTELDGAVSIYVSGNYAYVASNIDDGVEILDISNPANPTHVGAITDDGTTELDGAFSIYVSGNYAYVASYIDDGVEILDISNPANPTHVGAITDDGATALDGAFSIYVSGNYAYVASATDDGVEILDIDGIDKQLSFVSDTLSDSDLGVSANHSIGFTTSQSLSAGEYIKIELDPLYHKFSQSYSSATTTDITATGMTLVNAGGCSGTASEAEVIGKYSDPRDESLLLKVCAGDTIASGAKTLNVGNNLWTNPSTSGSYIIRISFGDDAANDQSGDTRVAIIDDVNITASMATAFTFTIAAKTSGTVNGESTSCEAGTTTTAIPFGTLTASNPKVACQTLSVATNAKNGFVVRVQQDQRLTSANGADIDTFKDDGQNSTPIDWVAPSDTLDSEATYGYMGVTSEDSDLNSDEFGSAKYAGNLLSARALFSHTGPANGSTANKGQTNVAYKVEIGSLQEAADDYSATLTYVATPTF
jgi:hypothetical protein